eukprot:CAMPEP_0176142088 /NCGR_PEP_ID=MMETSP0120_2-20121206/72276_1 /TAXON_ID=160619 /ORGANISM="Kryptoperidinium foliaceum, Strain CCMP 1326" /LENGTH=54 /DNA_ID=CAMNT_0017478285 /DNA_START=26 /DNA_END=187 /DNA_ORIENTATION=+
MTSYRKTIVRAALLNEDLPLALPVCSGARKRRPSAFGMQGVFSKQSSGPSILAR